MRIGISGCGLIGQLYGRVLRGLGAEIVAAADPAQGRAASVALAAFAETGEMLDAVSLDLLCVCSPTPFHAQAVMEAARRGVPVFLEKPMAETLAQAEAIHATGVVRGLGFKMRFETVFANTERLISEGAIGRPRFATLTFVQPVPPGERVWYVDVGVLRDMAVHPFDLVCWWFGSAPDEVFARTASELGRAGEDKAFVELHWQDGRHANITAGYLAGYPEIAGRDDIAFQVIGERGYLLGRRPDQLGLVCASGVTAVAVEPVDAFEAELRAFLHAFAHGETPPVTGADGLRAQRVIDAALRSARAGAPVLLKEPAHA